MAVDPIKGSIASVQTLMQYAYCLNNPIVLIDPYGLIEVGLRAYAETMIQGAAVNWNSATKTATVIYNGKTLTVKPTSNEIRDGRIYVDDSLFINSFGSDLKPINEYQAAMISDTHRGGGSLKIISASGHSWIEYTSSQDNAFFVGTWGWGNDGPNVYYNREDIDNYIRYCWFKTSISERQVSSLYKWIYKTSNSIEPWTESKDCVWFAVNAWSTAGQSGLDGALSLSGKGSSERLMLLITNKYKEQKGYYYYEY
jgi:hypothetical protein